MKKYKVIKQFPASYLEVGEILEFKGDSFSKSLKGYEYFYTLEDMLPEFFEEVVDKEYEILSFKMQAYKELILTLRENREYIVEDRDLSWGGYSLEDMLRDCTIYSVKRLSDGAIFTVGDKITFDSYKQKHNIIDFHLSKVDSRMLIGINAGHVGLSKVEHAPKPKFISEDGVEMYAGDTYYYMDHSYSPDKVHSMTVDGEGNYLNISTTRRFSTEKAAQKYIDDNKIVDVQMTQGKYNEIKHLL